MSGMGASIPDTQATGSIQQSIFEWRKEMGIEPKKQVHLVRLAHMRYQHPDLEQISDFLQDFGMYISKKTEDEIWFRGYGNEPYVYYARKGPKKFLGGAFVVEKYEDLEKASTMEGASEIQALEHAPGGGFIVTLYDPENMPINLVFGQEAVEAGELPEKLILNYESEKPRMRKFQRFHAGPAAVYKVILLNYTRFIKTFLALTFGTGSWDITA